MPIVVLQDKGHHKIPEKEEKLLFVMVRKLPVLCFVADPADRVHAEADTAHAGRAEVDALNALVQPLVVVAADHLLARVLGGLLEKRYVRTQPPAGNAAPARSQTGHPHSTRPLRARYTATRH